MELLKFWCVYECVLSCFSCVWFFVTPWTVTCQTSLSMGFSRQEYWSLLPYLHPGDFPDPGFEPSSPTWSAQWLLNDSIAILWRSGEEGWNPLCAKHLCYYIRENEGNESEYMLLQTLTPLAELAVPAILAIMPITSNPLVSIIPIQPQFLALGLTTSLPNRGQLENPVLGF